MGVHRRLIDLWNSIFMIPHSYKELNNEGKIKEYKNDILEKDLHRIVVFSVFFFFTLLINIVINLIVEVTDYHFGLYLFWDIVLIVWCLSFSIFIYFFINKLKLKTIHKKVVRLAYWIGLIIGVLSICVTEIRNESSINYYMLLMFGLVFIPLIGPKSMYSIIIGSYICTLTALILFNFKIELFQFATIITVLSLFLWRINYFTQINLSICYDHEETMRIKAEKRLDNMLREFFYFVYEIDLDRETFVLTLKNRPNNSKFRDEGNLKEEVESISFYVHPDDCGAFLNIISADYLKESFKKGNDKIVTEFRYLRRNGIYYWISATFLSDKANENGNSCVVLIQDIDQSKRKEAVKKIDDKRLELILGNAYDTIMETNLITGEHSILTIGYSGLIRKPVLGGYLEFYNEEIDECIHPDDAEKFKKLYEYNNIIEELEKGTRAFKFEFRRIGQDGNYHWMSYHTVKPDDTNDSLLFHFIKNIDKSKRDDEKRRSIERRLEMMLRDLYDRAFEIDINSDSFITLKDNLSSFANFADKGNYSEMILKNANDIVYPGDRDMYLEKANPNNLKKLFAHGDNILNIEYRQLDFTGNYRWVSLTYVRETGTNDNIILMGLIKDINDIKINEQELKRSAELDQLTGLYNKFTTEKLIDDFLQKDNSGNRHVFMIIDFDDFKLVNDTFGHLCGDNVLADITNKIRSIFREEDIVGRVGGDEFVAFMKNINSVEYVSEKAEQLRNLFSSTVFDIDCNFKISCSIGIAMYNRDGINFEQLYRNADKALYQAKNSGRDRYHFYNSSND